MSYMDFSHEKRPVYRCCSLPIIERTPLTRIESGVSTCRTV
jgi:hypothetical protein